MAIMWRAYDWPDSLAIEKEFKDRPFWADPRAVTCPIDGTETVRSYYHRMTEQKTARYRWCPTCRRYSGQTTEVPAHLTMSEPVKQDVELSLPRLLDRANALWEVGKLPQEFQAGGD